eukprot:CAMPEP_0114549186 /NCGR_PEP_ID=MMETSP0114-20121206/5393_1 /TAXON_ID=31324 /ORGANISM="Goniomonas sp, Strain m" /LENGTH=271 /DNA_ID=CAMNT_0001733851 /DNA_START=8 /DNA_END=819 /DNA_ORIENTATION=-
MQHPQGYAQPAPGYQQYPPQQPAPVYQQYAPQNHHYPPPPPPAEISSMLRSRCRADAITAIVFSCLCIFTCWGSFYLPISGIAGILALVAGPLCLANLSRHKTNPRSGLYNSRNLYIAVAVFSGIAVVSDGIWFGFIGWSGFDYQQDYLSCSGGSSGGPSSYGPDSCQFNNYDYQSQQYCYDYPPSCYVSRGYGNNFLVPFSITAFVNLMVSVALLAVSITAASHASMLLALLPPSQSICVNPLYQAHQPQPQMAQPQMAYRAQEEHPSFP